MAARDSSGAARKCSSLIDSGTRTNSTVWAMAMNPPSEELPSSSLPTALTCFSHVKPEKEYPDLLQLCKERPSFAVAVSSKLPVSSFVFFFF